MLSDFEGYMLHNKRNFIVFVTLTKGHVKKKKVAFALQILVHNTEMMMIGNRRRQNRCLQKVCVTFMFPNFSLSTVREFPFLAHLTTDNILCR